MRHSHWEHKKIGELFDVQLGKMLSEKARKGLLSPYLANFNVRWGSFDLSNLNEMFFSDREKEKFSIKKGDLLMCEGGEIGRCAVWKEETSPFYYQKALHRLRPLDERIISEFVYYYMQFIASKGVLPKIVGETSIAHLTREKLLHLPIPVPPRAEQKQIIEKIQLWDSSIEKTERLILAKEKCFKFLLQKTIFVPASIEGHWKHFKLCNITERVQRKSKGGTYPILMISSSAGFVTQETKYSRFMAGKSLEDYLLLQRGEFAYNKGNSMRYQFGCIYPLNEYDEALVPHIYVCFRFHENMESNFFNQLFQADYLKNQLGALVNTGVRNNGLLNISPDNFMKVKVPVPPLTEQKRIAKILNSAQQEIKLLKKQAEAYRKQKRGLMQKILTGQWRVGARHAFPLQDAVPIGDSVPLPG